MQNENISSYSIRVSFLNLVLGFLFLFVCYSESPAEQAHFQRHSLMRDYPGQVALDLWGWTGTINYQRTKGHATPEYFIGKVGQESNCWGANFIECMPFKIDCGGFVMSWDINDPIQQPEKGVYFFPNSNWSDQDYRKMLSAMHQLGMLNSLCINTIGATWGSKLPKGWQKPDRRHEIDTMQRWSRDFFNPLLYGRNQGYFDVLDTERIEGMEIDLMWRYNPGAVPMYCATNDRGGSNGYTYSFCCAGLKRNLIRGLDDTTTYKRSVRDPYFSYQADSRPRKTLHPWGRFGGYTYPDWIVKQLNDYCRVRLKSGTNYHTALWWFNEVEEMHDSIDRQYIYGCSMDPIRCAVAVRLFITGWFDKRSSKLNPDKIGGLELFPYSRGTPVLQNNHLRLYLANWQDQKRLVYDADHLGEYDYNHQNKLELTNAFLKTAVSERKNSPTVIGFINGQSSDFNKLWNQRQKYMKFKTDHKGWYMIALAQCPNEKESKIRLRLDDQTISTFNTTTKNVAESYIHTYCIPLMPGNHKLDLECEDNNFIDALAVNLIEYIGTPDKSGSEFKAAGEYNGVDAVYQFHKDVDEMNRFPGGLSPDGKKWPKTIDLTFGAQPGLYALQLHVSGKGPLEFFLDNQRILLETIDIGLDKWGEFPVFFGISQAGKHTLRIMTWDNEVTFDSVGLARLFNEGVNLRIEEPAGYWASIIENKYIPTLSGHVREKTRYTVRNDAPWIEVELDRTMIGNTKYISSIIGCQGYTHLHTDKSTYQDSTQRKAVPDVLLLRDDTGVKPDMVLAMIKKGNIESFSFVPRQKLQLISNCGKSEKIKLAAFVTSGLYDHNDINKNYREIINCVEEPDTSNTSEITIVNKLDIPVIRLASYKKRERGPFYVRETSSSDSEQGWWMFRGGQSAYSKDATCVRSYVQPNSTVKIQKYGFINGKVKSGIGSQYIIAIRDDITDSVCTVNVLNVTPYIFAPSVVFKRKFNAVKVNGRDWHYFEDHTVYLLNRKGSYKIEVSIQPQNTPQILRTQALINQTSWDGKILKFNLQDPPWYPYGMPYYMVAIALERFRIQDISNNAEIIPPQSLRLKNDTDLQYIKKNYAILKLKTGKSEVRFKKISRPILLCIEVNKEKV